MPQVDYAALAAQARQRPTTAPVDYAALAAQARTATTAVPAQSDRTWGDTARDVAIGAVKGAGNTAIGLGELVHRIPGVSRGVDALYDAVGIDAVPSREAFPAARALVQPTNTAQKVGFYGEQIGEFFLPAGAVSRGARIATEAVKSGGLTAAQGGSDRAAMADAGLSLVIPGAGAVRRGGKAIADAAEPLVRAAIKPTVASLRRITGGGGLDAKANAMVRFIIDNRLTTPEKARALFQEAEHELQRVLSVKNAPTDAATRAGRYLQALERSAGRQGLGADDVALIRKSADDLLAGPMGETVGVTANGEPIRALRAAVPAKEALDSARASSRWTTRKSWGEQKGATTEAAKAVERAQRDAVKTIPEAKALLGTEAKALQSAEALDRMAQRASNRDAVSLPAHVIAGAELASGRVPMLAFAANWLRNNQMKAGMWADSLGKAIQAGNAPMVSDILKKLGVGASSQAMRPAPATP